MPLESGEARNEQVPMTEEGASRPAGPTYWLIVKHESVRMEVLTIERGGEEVLPVFSFPEEAVAFLGLEGCECEWRIKESPAGELASVLLGICRNVRRVAFDQLPRTVNFVSLDREGFVRHLLGEREPRWNRSEEIVDETTEGIAIPDYVMWDFGGGGDRG